MLADVVLSFKGNEKNIFDYLFEEQEKVLVKYFKITENFISYFI